MRSDSGLLPSLIAAVIAVAAPGSQALAAPASDAPPKPAVTEPSGPASQPEEGDGTGPNLHDPMVEARRAYDLGRKLYDEAKYEEALGSFLDAQRLYASPDHHFNIARCYEALGRYPLAVEYYRAYLRSNPSDRANIENTITRIEAIIARSNEPAPEPTPVAPEPATQPEPTPPTDGQDDRGAYPGRGLVIGGAVLAAVGAGLGIGAGVGAGVAARDRSDQVEAVFDGGNPEGLDLDATRTLDEEGRRFETIQIAGAVVGGALAAGGVAMLVVGLRKKKMNTTVSSLLGPGLAGVTVGGRF